jgi:hypothetical protein
VSRSLHPKQLLPIAANHSMLQATMARLCGAGYGSPIVFGGEEHRFLIADQLAEDGCTPAAIILEPEGRNTAAAIALAAHFALTHDTAAVLFAVPSDHVIADSAAFDGAVATGSAPRGRGGSSPSASPPPVPKSAMAVSNSARRSTGWRGSTQSPASSRSAMQRPRKRSSMAAATRGTAASSCSAHARISML